MELDIKIEKFNQLGVNLVSPEQMQEQKVEYIKQTTNLMNYDIFKKEHNMPQRKKDALKETAGLVLIELALYHQTVNDVNVELGDGIEEDEINQEVDEEQNGNEEQKFSW